MSGDIVEIDAIDEKILKMLINNARARIKDIAKECGVSAVSVLNRIKRLEKLKVIIGATVFPDLQFLELPVVATIGVQYGEGEVKEILKLIGEQAFVVEPSECFGEFDAYALVFAKSINELDKIVSSLRRHFGASKVVVNVWSGAPIISYGNVDLRPLAAR